jgi:cell division septum initiation protein DivIVA
VQRLEDANKREGQLLEETQGDVKRLAGLNREKDMRIKNLETDLQTRTRERDEVQDQYEYVQQQFVECLSVRRGLARGRKERPETPISLRTFPLRSFTVKAPDPASWEQT